MRFWHEFWPQIIAVSFAVGIAGNLMAAVIWALPAFVHLHRKLNRQHKARMDQADRHHHAHMKALGIDLDDITTAARNDPGSAAA